MAKENYDAKRAAILKVMHLERVKAAAKAKKDAEVAAAAALKVATAEQNIVSDAKID